MSDSIVLWRAWVIWNRKRSILIISGLLIIISICTCYTCTSLMFWLELRKIIGISIFNLISNVVSQFETTVGRAVGITVLLLFSVSNFWATALITYKAWFVVFFFFYVYDLHPICHPVGCIGVKFLRRTAIRLAIAVRSGLRSILKFWRF